MAELEKDEAERVRKEDEKRRKAALGMWRKFLMGMRIVERIRQEYGEIDESVSVFGHSRGGAPAGSAPKVHDEELAGGFLPEGYEDEEDDQARETSSFFPALEEDDEGGDGDLVMEDGRDESVGDSHTEARAESSTKSRKYSTRSRKTRTTREKKQTVIDEDDQEDDD
jgi:xeroderma pigmentosum group C-complementing protein